MAEMTESTGTIREHVRERYAAVASRAGEGGCCGGPAGAGADAAGFFGSALYDDDDRQAVPESALEVSLGCGNPTAMVELEEGQAVLDLGSGAGTDALLSATRVGPAGKVYGLDMTDEMLDLARRNAERAEVTNVEWLKGYIEEIPLPDASVDVVISNCVINLSGDKPKVIREAARVLRPGGRFAVSDVIADADMDEGTRRDMAQWTGCIAGALTRGEFESVLRDAGLEGVEIVETHRVHEHAVSAPRARGCAPRRSCTTTGSARSGRRRTST
jgi:arsenite methyltransferase